ncbi:hypothetical protein C1645_820026 [Glomus cerebriforme]|uniref:F-box domain-containing protein n=1 Tax=Glomus cerebriforme TaxID=658196 RepID=A0A397T9A2_9GLOM|nr:hypothetical protein C1645_820026 [Glomus cerebriforme]
MGSKLNKDNIFEILEYLRDDKSSLYSCILINRTWCSITIPIIWETPFSRNNKNWKTFKIIQTLISCLKEEEITTLMNKIGHSLEFIMKPLFYYPTFIKEINFSKFEQLIESHYNYFYTNTPTNIDLEIFTIQLLGNMIFNNHIKEIIFNYNYIKYFKYKHFNCFENLINFKGINKSLKYLQIFKLNLYIPHISLSSSFQQIEESEEIINYITNLLINFFNNLSKITINIKYLSIYLKFDNIERSVSNRICEAFSQLIQVQKNLEYLEINEFSGYSSLTTSLISKSTSLTTLKINFLKNFHILLLLLSKCTNLITLELTELFEIEQDILTDNNDLLPPIHLENLLIYHLNIRDNINKQHFISFMKSLFKLSFKIKKIVLEFITFELLDIIKLYSSNSLEYFSLQLFPHYVIKFCEILPQFQNLNTLIVIEWLGGNDLPISLENLILLANSLPKSLKFLDIYKTLDDEFMNVIIQYVLEKNRNLKRLGYLKVHNNNFKINSDLMIKINELIPIIEETKFIKHTISGPNNPKNTSVVIGFGILQLFNLINFLNKPNILVVESKNYVNFPGFIICPKLISPDFTNQTNQPPVEPQFSITCGNYSVSLGHELISDSTNITDNQCNSLISKEANGCLSFRPGYKYLNSNDIIDESDDGNGNGNNERSSRLSGLFKTFLFFNIKSNVQIKDPSYYSLYFIEYNNIDDNGIKSDFSITASSETYTYPIEFNVFPIYMNKRTILEYSVFINKSYNTSLIGQFNAPPDFITMEIDSDITRIPIQQNNETQFILLPKMPHFMRQEIEKFEYQPMTVIANLGGFHTAFVTIYVLLFGMSKVEPWGLFQKNLFKCWPLRKSIKSHLAKVYVSGIPGANRPEGASLEGRIQSLENILKYNYFDNYFIEKLKSSSMRYNYRDNLFNELENYHQINDEEDTFSNSNNSNETITISTTSESSEIPPSLSLTLPPPLSLSPQINIQID